jgi:hypothetical protein
MNSPLFSETHITQKYIRRYGRTKRVKAWESKVVHIRTENGVWRINAKGYTYPNTPEAWILPFKEAEKQISHCGPEKQGCFLLAQGQEPVITTKATIQE